MLRVLSLLCVLALSSCATTPSAVLSTDDPLTTLLDAATTDIKAALYLLAETQNAAAQKGLTPQQKAQAVAAATLTPAGLDNRITLQWVGPLDGALKSLAEQTGYRYQVYGRAPITPIIVRVEAKEAPAIVTIRDVAFQAGERARVSIFERNRTLQLKYHDAL